MIKMTDSILMVLFALFIAIFLAYSFDYIPYPYGMIFLSIFMVARILHLKKE